MYLRSFAGHLLHLSVSRCRISASSHSLGHLFDNTLPPFCLLSITYSISCTKVYHQIICQHVKVLGRSRINWSFSAANVQLLNHVLNGQIGLGQIHLVTFFKIWIKAGLMPQKQMGWWNWPVSHQLNNFPCELVDKCKLAFLQKTHMKYIWIFCKIYTRSLFFHSSCPANMTRFELWLAKSSSALIYIARLPSLTLCMEIYKPVTKGLVCDQLQFKLVKSSYNWCKSVKNLYFGVSFIHITVS